MSSCVSFFHLCFINRVCFLLSLSSSRYYMLTDILYHVIHIQALFAIVQELINGSEAFLRFFKRGRTKWINQTVKSNSRIQPKATSRLWKQLTLWVHLFGTHHLCLYLKIKWTTWHRATEWSGLERTFKDRLGQPHCHGVGEHGTAHVDCAKHSCSPGQSTHSQTIYWQWPSAHVAT